MNLLLSILILFASEALIYASETPPNGVLPLDIHKRDEVLPDGVVAIDIHHKREINRFGKRQFSKYKRDASNDIYGSYVVVFGVGTPQQTQSGIVDTGSSDLWINGPWSGQTPFFNPALSTTYKYVSSGFYIAYGSGDASGYWITETLNIAGSNLTNQQLGLVNNRDAGQAVFGIGMMGNEVSNQQYSNVPQSLYTQGLIKANSYSIYLDDLSSSTGRILFGGLDSKKYNGSLQVVPVTDNESFYIDINEIDVAGQTVTNGKFSGLVDSGTTFCYFPTNIARNIAKLFNAQFDSSTGLYFVQNNSFPDNEFVFNFSGVKIRVPPSEMLVDSQYIVQGAAPAPYVLGIVQTDDLPYILGDTFLRSAYVVFDTNRRQIALAQASYSKDADITVITGSGIPGAYSAPGYNANDGGYKTILTVGAPAASGLITNQIQNEARVSPIPNSPTPTPAARPSSFQWPWWWPFQSSRRAATTD